MGNIYSSGIALSASRLWINRCLSSGLTTDNGIIHLTQHACKFLYIHLIRNIIPLLIGKFSHHLRKQRLNLLNIFLCQVYAFFVHSVYFIYVNQRNEYFHEDLLILSYIDRASCLAGYRKDLILVFSRRSLLLIEQDVILVGS